MRIALTGMGRMGEAVSRLAAERGHEIAARFDARIDRYPALPDSAERPAALRGADVVIDFTLPDAAPENIERYARWGIPAVIGTTGWYDRLDAVKALVAERDGAILYAPNFSIGVALLARAVRAILPLLNALPEYDVAVREAHHVGKADSPSGTALMLGDLILDALDRKRHMAPETQHGRIAPEALHVTSSRLGEVVGKHDISLDSPFDNLTFSHEAKNRQGFAFGAVRAAEWLPGRKGFFTLDDLLDEWLGA